MRNLISIAASVLVVILSTSGCGPDANEAETPDHGEIQTLTAESCPPLLPPLVVNDLGWTQVDEPRFEEPQRCILDAEEGSVSLTRRAVPAVGGEDLPGKARQTLEDRCEFHGATRKEARGWFSQNDDACASVAGGAHTTSTLILLTEDNRVFEISVEADVATSDRAVKAALIATGEAAQQLGG